MRQAGRSRDLVRAATYCLATISAALGTGMPAALGRPPAQAETEISADATPQIVRIKPAEAAPGSEVSVVIEGANFARGVYVAFVNPALHAVSTNRQSATQLEAKIQVGQKAQPGPVILYVSNPASAAAQGTFTVTAQPRSAPETAEIKPSAADTPEIAAIDPPRATKGSELGVKVTGKKFAQGAKVAFSNPGIRVMDTQFAGPTELNARIRVAPDATTGRSSVFVINPGNREVEAPFEVAEAGSVPGTPPAEPAKPATATGGAMTSGASATYDVYNLGEGMNIFQSLNKPKGKLTLSGGKLRYEETGKEVFSAGASDLKEVEMNVIGGFNTGTFHVMLSSGKTFNFAPASLKPADSQAIVDAVRRAPQ